MVAFVSRCLSITIVLEDPVLSFAQRGQGSFKDLPVGRLSCTQDLHSRRASTFGLDSSTYVRSIPNPGHFLSAARRAGPDALGRS